MMDNYEPGRTLWNVALFEQQGIPFYGFRDVNDVLEIVKIKDLNIKFIRLFFPDINGMINDFFIPVSELASAFEKGKGFDGSSVKGMMRIEESDLVFFPDPTSFRILPFLYEGKTKGLVWRNAIAFGDIKHPDGRPFMGDSRYILKRNLQKMKKYDADHFYVGNEMEFFLISDIDEPSLLDQGAYFRGGSYGDLRSEVQLLLEVMGIPTEYDHHEVAASQHEIDFVFDDAINIADKTLIFRYIVKKIARENGIFATFAPKPFPWMNGSGMHTHMSLWRQQENLFYDPNGEFGLSKLGHRFLSGLLKYLPELMLTTNPWLNSYERLIPGFEAPTMRAVDLGNRSSCIRIPAYGERPQSKRLEVRSPDPSCNIYLALSSMFAAGLNGIDEGVTNAVIVDCNIYELSAQERLEKGILPLPGTLKEALDIASTSNFLRTAIGDHLTDILLADKENDWTNYLKARAEQVFSEDSEKKKKELHEFNIMYSRKELLAAT
ncbi:glutamine synthetase family protein [candidate division CSSED10-310 bacterium]|uniref:Glutamine synthetase n=1 Tax=candidate division CSSED10-310 bacterium TaxID=2855610 RepID=A0ABV6Z2L6_UNCC1